MNALDLFRQSSAWDSRYDLPLCPGNDNPWLYGAYALKIMRENGLSAFEDLKLCERFIAYADLCELEPGLYSRWPENKSDPTSHDEIMGMSYVSAELARKVFTYLEKTDGVYITQEEKQKQESDWQYRYNVYRMVWLKPFIKARMGSDLNLLTQLPFASHLILDALTTTHDGGIRDQGGRLRIWIMLEALNKFALAGAAVSVWKTKMNSVGLSPRTMLQIEPKEFPIYGALGAKEF